MSPAPGWKATALVVGIWLAAALWRAGDGCPLEGDSATYSVLSESLASGKGLRDIDQPDAPPHRHFPPLYPLGLAALRLLGVDEGGLCALGILAGAVFLAALMRGFPGLFPEGLAAPLVLLAGSGLVHRYALPTLSDVPGAAMSVLGLLAARKYGAAGRTVHASGFLAAALLLGAVLVREASLSALAAACAWLLLDAPAREGRRRKAVFLALAVAGAWILWAWSWREPGDPRPFLSPNTRQNFLQRDLDDAKAGAPPAAEFARRLRNAVLRDQPVYLARMCWVGLDHPPPWVSFSLSALAALGFLWSALRRRGIAEYFVAATWAMLCLNALSIDRYFLPVAPFLLAYAARGACLAAGLLPALGRRASLGLAAAAWTAAVFGTLHRLSGPEPVRARDAEFRSAMGWLARTASPGDVALNRHSARVYLLARIRCMAPEDGEAAKVEDALGKGRLRWIVTEEADRGLPQVRNVVLPAIARHRDRIVERHRTGDVAVLEVLAAR